MVYSDSHFSTTGGLDVESAYVKASLAPVTLR